MGADHKTVPTFYEQEVLQRSQCNCEQKKDPKKGKKEKRNKEVQTTHKTHNKSHTNE